LSLCLVATRRDIAAGEGEDFASWQLSSGIKGKSLAPLPRDLLIMQRDFAAASPHQAV
jgi:hypothetical protein